MHLNFTIIAKNGLPLLLLFGLCKPAYSEKSYYVISDENKKKGCTVTDLTEIDQKAALPEDLDQKDTSTCYGHAAYYLLQYHYNLSKGNDRSKQENTLSLTDALGQGCQQRFVNGGDGYAVLHNLKNRSISINRDYDVEKVVKFSKWINKNPNCDAEECCEQFKQNFDLPGAGIRLIPDIENVVERFLPQDRDKLAYNMLFQGITRKPKQESIPSYNVEVFQPVDETLKKEPGLTKESLVKNEMRSLLKPVPPKQITYPVTLGFCVGEKKSGECTGKHEVVIAGSRKLCCGKDCTEEWKIINSYGGADSGWHKADPLSRSIAKHHGDMTSIRPCTSEKPEPGQPAVLPACQFYIKGPLPIHYLIDANDEKNLEQFLKENRDRVDRKDGAGNTPLDLAARQSAKMTRFLLNYGRKEEIERSLNLPNTPSPLDTAAYKGRVEVLKEFFETDRKRVFRRDQYGDNLLHSAIDGKKLKAVQYLIQFEPKLIYQKNDDGLLPVQLASKQGGADLLKELIDRDSKLMDKLDSKGNTLLHLAVRGENLEAIQYLIRKNPKLIYEKNERKETVIDLAIRTKRPEALEALASELRQASLKKNPFLKQDSDGWTPAHFAAWKGDAEIVDVMYQSVPETFKIKDNKGMTAAHLAAKAGNDRAIKVLLKKEAGALLTAQDLKGRTPLHLAVREKNWDVVDRIARRKPEAFHIKDKDGLTPLDYMGSGKRRVDLENRVKAAGNGDPSVVPKELITPIKFAQLTRPSDNDAYQVFSKTDLFNPNFISDPTQLRKKFEQEKEKWQRRNTRSPLAYEEALAIMDYSSSWYRAINRRLRSQEDIPLDQDDRIKLGMISHALTKIPPYEGNCYRVVNDLPSKVEKALQKGTVFQEQGFMSTSSSEDIRSIYNANAKYEFRIRGKSGRSISQYSLKPTEGEVLFPPGVSFKVLDRKTIKVGVQGRQQDVTIIDLEEVSN